MSQGIPQQAPLDPAALQAALGQMLASHAPQMQQMQQHPAPQWGPPQQAMMPAGAMMQPAPSAAHGLLVPVGLQLPDGRDCTVYIHLGPEAAQNPMGAILGLINSGVPVKAYQPRQQGNGGGNWGGSRGGNWGGNNGGGRGGWGR